MDKMVNVKNYVGIDLGKKTHECVRINDDDSLTWFKGKIDKDIKSLLKWLKPNDVVAIEAGTQSFRIAKTIKAKTECEVLVLNPGDLQIIYKSLRKIDKDDALKLARMAKRFPKEELSVVSIPTDEEEDARRLSTEQAFWNKELTKSKNRLHSLFAQAGLTHISKKHLSNKKHRKESIELLPDRFRRESQRLNSQMDNIEEALKDVGEEIKGQLIKKSEETAIAMSMPGIGPILTLAIQAYIGNGDRFSKAKQVSNYVGLVPRVDISSTQVRYGSIIKRGCTPIRRCIIQGAWALVKSKYGGPLQDFYNTRKAFIGKKKAIVAVARKMIETIYVMLQKKELYSGCNMEILNKKLKSYGLV